MRTFLTSALLAGSLWSAAAFAAPPREESPAPRENLEAFGQGSSDEEMAKAIAAASAHPLGTLQNPVRVAGPQGARDYLARLRCDDGSTPSVGRDVPGSVGAFGTLTTIFPVTCATSQPVQLAFDFYQEEYRENRAPTGFRMAP